MSASSKALGVLSDLGGEALLYLTDRSF